MHTIKVWRDPYDNGWNTTRRKEIEFTPGITILVGCNGIGKTTLLRNIKEQLKKEKIPCYYYNNLKDGGDGSISNRAYHGDFTMVASMLMSSEGENITNNIGIMFSKLRNFKIKGYNGKINPFDDEQQEVVTKERWILLDAIDSGYSIDNVIELKESLTFVLEDAHKNGYELYIVISANEYELAANMTCLDVAEGRYVTFSDYNDFRNFILHSREKKNKRYKIDGE